MKTLENVLDELNWLYQQTQTLVKRTGLIFEPTDMRTDRENLYFLMGKLEGLAHGIIQLEEIDRIKKVIQLGKDVRKDFEEHGLFLETN